MSTETEAPAISDQWVEQAEALCEQHLAEAESLRYTGGLPDASLGSGEVLSRLAVIRTRLDRVDELLAEVSRFRTGARVLLKEATARVDDKWAERVAGSTATSRRKGSFVGSGEMEGPRERYARADVAVVGDRMLARRRERVMDAVGDAVEAITRVHRGLDSVRFDLHAMLKLFSVEHRLERTDG